MFFVLSKTAAFFLVPSNLLIMLCLAGGLLMATRWRRAGRWLLIAGLIGFVVVGFSPLGAWLSHDLERRFPPWDASRGPPDGIVVLGGAISPGLSRDHGETVITGDAGRLVAMAKLAREYPNARLVYSGGDASLFGVRMPEANYLNPLLDSFGVPRNRVMLESRSRNTAENAAFTKELVNPKPGERWLLVTSAQHMPRAVGCFRQAGFPVEAYPVAWYTGKTVRLMPRWNLSSGLARTDSAVSEWIGLLAYWITGRTGEFLPGPPPAQ